MTSRTPPRTILATLAALALACASSPEQEAEGRPDLGQGTVEASRAMAQGMKDGAQAFGRGMGTAYRGMRDGFEEADGQADYGPFPKDYVDMVRKHFHRVMRYPEDTRFSFGRPGRGYMNQGILRGGGIAWQGWLVDVEVETVQTLTRHRAESDYVVRIRNGEIIEVHKDDSLLRRVPTPPAASRR